jgi:hypothetical protein
VLIEYEMLEPHRGSWYYVLRRFSEALVLRFDGAADYTYTAMSLGEAPDLKLKKDSVLTHFVIDTSALDQPKEMALPHQGYMFTWWPKSDEPRAANAADLPA